MVDGHPNIKMATSVVDYIFRVLGLEYLNRTDFVQVKPKIAPIDLTAEKGSAQNTYPKNPSGQIAAEAKQIAETKDAMSFVAVDKDAAQAQLAEMMGDAPPCDGCGHTTVRNGACYKCLNCGNSMGCS